MTLVRNDRTYGTGEGVALYVNSKIPFKFRKDLNDPSFEYHCMGHVTSKMVTKSNIQNCGMLCIYLPPIQSEIDSF